MRASSLAMLTLACLPLAACAPAWKPPEIAYDDTPHRAALEPDPPKPVKVVEIPKLLPLPGQLKPYRAPRALRRKLADPRARVDQANGEARVQPTRAGYLNAIQVYPFSDGALYQVYAAPGEITDIALEQGEQLVGSGPVAAGDTVRWIVGDTESGSGPEKRIHILIKPTRPDLISNLVINTDRRTYHLELRSDEKTYMASVSWTYLAGSVDCAKTTRTPRPKPRRRSRPASTSTTSTSAIASRATRRPGGRCEPSMTGDRCSSSSRPAFAAARCRRSG